MIIEGRFVNYDAEFYAQVYVEDGVITAVERYKFTKADKVFPDNFLIFPAMGDIHIHAREDESQKDSYKEDFSSTSLAALNGGVAFVFDMPNNPIPPVDDKTYLKKLSLIKKYKLPVDIFLYAGIGPETQPLSFEVPYKVFMGPSIGELFFKDMQSLEKALNRYRGKFVSFHCEDPYILEHSKDAEKHKDRRPREAANAAIVYAIYLIEKYNLKGKICHLPTGDSIQLLCDARRRGLDIEVEVTPQHLFWNFESMPSKLIPWLQMNPPIRMGGDKNRLLEAFKVGIIDYLATDHAPHQVCEKLKNFLNDEDKGKLKNLPNLSFEELTDLNKKAVKNYYKIKDKDSKSYLDIANKDGTSGTSQLDTYAYFITYLLSLGISPGRIAKATAYNPGKFLSNFPKLSEGKKYGYIDIGYQGKFTVIDPKQETLWTYNLVKSKSAWSPFHNYKFPGALREVLV